MQPEPIDADQTDIVKSITSRLDKIATALVPPEEASYLIGVDGPTHVVMRLKSLVISVSNSGATTVTLKIGTKIYTYYFSGPVTIVLPPPTTIIDRAADVTCTANSGDVSAYFRYTAE